MVRGFFRPLFASSGIPSGEVQSIAVDLGQVMHNAVEQPLRIHLRLSSQAEPIQSQDGSDVRKGRLGYRQPTIVNQSTREGVDLAPHLGRKLFR